MVSGKALWVHHLADLMDVNIHTMDAASATRERAPVGNEP
jgi:hypothetical protein